MDDVLFAADGAVVGEYQPHEPHARHRDATSGLALLDLDAYALVPYLKLPGGGYRIPQAPLLASLSGTYDLGREMEALDERYADVTEDQVRAAPAADEDDK